MKKIILISEESIFAGKIKSGMAELVDSLANSLTREYLVTVVCKDGNGILAKTATDLQEFEKGIKKCRFSQVNYYMIDQSKWEEKVPVIIDLLQPDILHNLAEPKLISLLISKPPRTVYTFDQVEFIFEQKEYLTQYDYVTTISQSYATHVLKENQELANILNNLDFRGITAGVLDTVFSPKKGLLIPATYNSENQLGKDICRQSLLRTYGIDRKAYICLMMCRFVQEKGMDVVIEAIPKIKESGGVLIVVGHGEEKYQKKLKRFNPSDGVIYINRWASPIQAAPLCAGADFYLCPSKMEACGLMPMTASLYGAIPIVTLNGGLADNFNEDNAIIVHNNNIEEAINSAALLYTNKEKLMAKRKICMEQDFSWTTRKKGFIELYEA